jgi:hypothetical protein
LQLKYIQHPAEKTEKHLLDLYLHAHTIDGSLAF